MPMWLRVAIQLLVCGVWGLFVVPQTWSAVVEHQGSGPPYVLWAVPGVTWVMLSGRGFIFSKEGLRVDAEKGRERAESNRAGAEEKRVIAEHRREEQDGGSDSRTS